MRPPNPVRDPIPAPTSSLVLSIFGAGFATHTVRFVDSVTENKVKPYGVKQMQLYLDQVNSGMLLPPANGKYDVSRALESSGQKPTGRLLE